MKILLVLFLSVTYGLSAMRDFDEYYRALQAHHARSPSVSDDSDGSDSE